jgi:hypothetical protein
MLECEYGRECKRETSQFTVHPDTTGSVFKLQRGVFVRNTRTIIRPSMRISMLSYNQIITFVLCEHKTGR